MLQRINTKEGKSRLSEMRDVILNRVVIEGHTEKVAWQGPNSLSFIKANP